MLFHPSLSPGAYLQLFLFPSKSHRRRLLFREQRLKSILDEPVLAVPLLVNPGMFQHLDSAPGSG